MTATASQTEYRVELPLYCGPLDLLLYLVKKHEVDILDIPIAVVTQSYLRYLEILQHIDIEAAGDFLVLASTLMEIKSRMLLPAQEEVSDEADGEGMKVDPRAELVKQLVAYRRFREAAVELEQLAASQAVTWPRGHHEKPFAELEPALQPLQPIELWDLVSAFDRLLRATLSHQQQAIEADDTPQHVYMARLLEQLQTASGPIAFEDMFTPPYSKMRLIGLFLALLELIKQQKIDVEQREPFGGILVRLQPQLALAS